MHEGLSVIAQAKATELVQPGDGALHHPAGLAQAGTMRGFLLG